MAFVHTNAYLINLYAYFQFFFFFVHIMPIFHSITSLIITNARIGLGLWFKIYIEVGLAQYRKYI